MKNEPFEVVYFSTQEFIFLRNELGWKFKYTDDLEFCVLDSAQTSNIVYVVLIGNDHQEVKKIRNLPENSVWVLNYGDEIWNPKLNRLILNEPSVIGVLRPYPFTTFPSKLPKKFFVSMANYVPRKFELRKLLIGILSSAAMVVRQGFLFWLHRKHGKFNIRFIPGYTNLFASAVGIAQSDSSKDSSLIDKNCEVTLRIKEFSFVGQKGSVWREFAIARVRQSLNAEQFTYLERQKFGGTLGANEATLQSASEYVQILKESRYVISPPGNYSGATFRWLESIICGAIPLQAFSHPSDPMYRPPIEIPEWLCSNSWEALLKAATNLSREDSDNLALLLRERVRTFLNEINDELGRLQVMRCKSNYLR